MKYLYNVILSAAIALSLAFNAVVLADDTSLPSIEIVGNEESVPVGEIVILQAKLSGDIPQNIKSVKYSWMIVDDGVIKDRVLVLNNGEQILFGSGITERSILVYVTASILTESELDHILIPITRTQVRIEKIHNTPGTTPGDKPTNPHNPPETPDGGGTGDTGNDDKPVPPDDKPKPSPASFREKVDSILASIEFSNEANAKATAKSLSSIFRQAAELITGSSGVIRNVKVLVDTTQVTSEEVLKRDPGNRKAFEEFSDKLNVLLITELSEDMNKNRRLWLDISASLENFAR